MVSKRMRRSYSEACHGSSAHVRTYRVSIAISTVRIEFSSFVSSSDVHSGKVTSSSHLDIVRCLEPVGAVDRALRDRARAMSLSCAPCDFHSLAISDGLTRRLREFDNQHGTGAG